MTERNHGDQPLKHNRERRGAGRYRKTGLPPTDQNAEHASWLQQGWAWPWGGKTKQQKKRENQPPFSFFFLSQQKSHFLVTCSFTSCFVYRTTTPKSEGNVNHETTRLEWKRPAAYKPLPQKNKNNRCATKHNEGLTDFPGSFLRGKKEKKQENKVGEVHFIHSFIVLVASSLPSSA